MAIWDALRRFTGGFGQGQKSFRSAASQAKQAKAIRRRDLRLEQFEDRLLLSIAPSAIDQDPLWNYQLAQSIQRAANLDRYENLEGVNRWVVGLEQGADAEALATGLNAQMEAAAEYLNNGFIWEFDAGLDPQVAIDRMVATEQVDYFYPLATTGTYRPMRTLPDDVLFGEQWHLRNVGQVGGMSGLDLRVTTPWDNYRGDGIVVGIVDDSLEQTHPDLSQNFRTDLSFDSVDGDIDPSPVIPAESHGTAVAGLVAAPINNGASGDLGVAGVAPEADLAGLRIDLHGLGAFSDDIIADVLSHRNNSIDIYNNSWGPFESFLYGPADYPMAFSALRDSIENGRDGLGNIYVFSAGNGRAYEDNVNFNGWANSRYTIAVAAVGHTGAVAPYSTPGASLLVSALGNDGQVGITTTDRVGDAGYNWTADEDDYYGADYPDPIEDPDYTGLFGGTSAAAPMVSGVVALMLEANEAAHPVDEFPDYPGLSWRDVQHILVDTARFVDVGDWDVNAAGYDISYDYGFGLVDADAAVQAAINWEPVDEEFSLSGSQAVGQAVPDANTTGVTSSITLENTVGNIEWVEVTFDAEHQYPGDLEVVLTSPSGTESVLARTNSYGFFDPITGRSAADMYNPAGYDNWTFTSARHWGESSGGDWTLTVRDLDGSGLPGDQGIWNSWSIQVYGTENVGFGPELIAVIPNAGEIIQQDDTLHVAPRELTLRFTEGQQIDPATLDGIRIYRSGGDGTFDAEHEYDVPVEIGWMGIGDKSNEVIVRFLNNLPDDVYQIEIDGTGDDALLNLNGLPFGDGEDSTLEFTLDLGVQVTSVVPQPVTRAADGTISHDRADEIEVYFTDDELYSQTGGSAADAWGPNPSSQYLNPEMFQLVVTQDTADTRDDVVMNAASGDLLYVEYFPDENRAVLKFAQPLHEFLDAYGGAYGTGAMRLRIGNEYRQINTSMHDPGGDVGAMFTTAHDVTNLLHTADSGNGIYSLVIPERILSDPADNNLLWPGANDEPGHRHLPPLSQTLGVENHIGGGDTLPGIGTAAFSFPDVYGADPWGNPLQNMITEAQKQRTREIFAMYGHYLGVQFYESEAGGLSIITGDVRAVAPTVPVEAVGGIASMGTAIMNNFFDWGESRFGGSWFVVAMHEIGHLLGFGHAYDLPPLTIMGSGEDLDSLEGDAEPVFPGKTDVIHGQHIWRNDSTDIDLYQFELTKKGVFKAETVAERLQHASLLDSTITIFRQTAPGKYEIVARNDDYYSGDSYVELELEPGTYYVGVTAAGNTDYDPVIDNTGMGGSTEGDYELRLSFEPQATDTAFTVADPATADELADTTGVRFDGDADGVPGGVYDFWFKTASDEGLGQSRTIYVDKAAKPGDDIGPDVTNPDGTLSAPYYEIDQALAAAQAGDIVRIVGHPGEDGDFSEIDDNLAYEIGFTHTGMPLEDGWRMEIPQGVTVMADAGAVFKMRRANIDVGSSAQDIDRSLGALQVLGTPDNSVYFTSYYNDAIGVEPEAWHPGVAEGDWGGLVFRNDLDYDEGYKVLETEGIFLNYVNNADFSYGGGEVVVNSVAGVYNPIHMIESRPTVSFNRIHHSADAAMSGDPNSFADNKYQSNHFTADYDRVGPDLHGNTLYENSINGVFVRIDTDAGKPLTEQEVVARWDDLDIVHVVQENLVLSGNPGGPLYKPGDVALSLADAYTLNASAGNAYSDRQTFALNDGTRTVVFEFDNISYNNGLTNSEHIRVPFKLSYSEDELAQSLVDAINEANTTRGLDITASAIGSTITLDAPVVNYEGIGRRHTRIDARLTVDPGVMVKIDGSRIEAEFGAHLIAEGTPGYPVLFTSVFDDRYGAGGSFDQTSDGDRAWQMPGDWGGFFLNPTSSATFDQSIVMFGGGNTRIEGGFARFNPIEAYQASLRVANSQFRDNAAGNAGDRNGRGRMFGSTIFVRGSMPVVVDNVFRGNEGPVMNIDGNSMESTIVTDWGRSTGMLKAHTEIQDNHGPLVYGNRLTDNEVNGMVVRGVILNTETIWDDTDIVHVVSGQYSGGEVLFEVPNHHHLSGLRLQSSPTESLVVKLDDPDAGFLASGWLQEIDDRIGGTIQVVGTPLHPVVLTSLADDTVGAGFDIFGQPQTDTNNDENASTPEPGAWNSIRLEKYSNDRNVAIINELEPTRGIDVDANALPTTAEYIGQLAAHLKDGDDNLREGFQVHGFIRNDDRNDADVYSFHGTAGSEVWIDIDRTTYALDTVVELVDANGMVISRVGPKGTEFASSDNSVQEETAMLDFSESFTLRSTMGRDIYDSNYYRTTRDFFTMNPRDAGMRVILPGPAGEERVYYVRVRSAGPVQEKTFGAYQLQIRLREMQELPGSTVRYADIRYATNGIEIHGAPIHSPLLGESYDRDNTEYWNGSSWVQQNTANNDTIEDVQGLGNILAVDRNTIAVGGDMRNRGDIDWFEFDVDMVGIQSIPGLNDLGMVWPLTFDIDYADGMVRPDTYLWVFNEQGELILIGSDSNIAGDRPGYMELDTEQLQDLERGSFGAFDPYIGDVYLPEGNDVSYYVAVTTKARIPQALRDQPLLRREPVNSIARVREDHLNLGDPELSMIPGTPSDRLFGKQDAHDVADLNAHADPYHLGDVVMYVNTASDVHTLDGFTGAYETDVTGTGGYLLADTRSGPLLSYRDIVMRNDGWLYSTTSRPGADWNAYNPNEWAGRYRRIDTGTGEITHDGPSGITTYQVDPENPETLIEQLSGVQFEALAHHPTDNGNRYVYAVGNRLPGLGVEHIQNLLYKLDSGGAAIDYPGNDGGPRLPTDIVPLGELLTGPMIRVVDATDTSFSYYDPGDVFNGLDIQIVGEHGDTYLFEMDCGEDVLMGLDGAAEVRDAEYFWLVDNQATLYQPDARGRVNYPVLFEFNSGPVIDVEDINPAESLDRYWFALTDNDSKTAYFEFDNNGAVDSDERTRIDFRALADAEDLAQRIVDAITDADIGVEAALNPADPTRITLSNDTALVTYAPDPVNPPDPPPPPVEADLPGIVVDGDYSGSELNSITDIDWSKLGADAPTNPGQVLHLTINYEETDSDQVFGTNIVGRVEGGPLQPMDFEASYAHREGVTFLDDVGDRLTFYNDSQQNFVAFFGEEGADTGVPSWTHREGQFADPQPANYARIAFEAEDDFATLADAIVARINQVVPGVDARTIGSGVAVDGVISVTVEAPLTTDGSGPGGQITGMAFVGNDLYAVSDRGGLYVINNWNARGFYPVDPDGGLPHVLESAVKPSISHIATFDRAGENVRFSGLARGPQNVENGTYADMLFAVDDGSIPDSNSWMYAFDTAGVEQGVFLDAASRMELEIDGALGIDFSNIDYNLWHVTNARGSDPGHGVNEHWDTSRNGGLGYPTTSHSPPDTSFYFGLEDPRPTTTISTQPGAGNYTPAGSNTGALDTYDVPGGAYGTLTTNTFSLEGYDRTDEPFAYINYYLDSEEGDIWDGARVYASADGVSWTPLSTSVDTNTSLFADPLILDWVQEIYEEDDTWRQMRLDLGGFAGQDDIRLRFVFSTATDLHVGSLMHTGSYLAGRAGERLYDGETFTIDGVTFELDMGHAVTLPDVAGTSIFDGQWIEIDDEFGNTVRFEFNKYGGLTGDVEIPIADGETTSDVLDETAWRINNDLTLQGVSVDIRDYELRIVGASDIRHGHPSMDPTLDVVKVVGNGVGHLFESANHAVAIHHDYTAEQVAEAIAIEMDIEFSGSHGAIFTSCKLVNGVIHTIGHEVEDAGPLAFSDSLYADHPDEYNYDRFLSDNPGAGNSRGMNNRFEGFYIDDIIIGFAEHGETVTGATADTDFVTKVLTPDPMVYPEPITRGEYQLEIRRSDDYGIWNEMAMPPYLVLGKSYDTNDRLENGATMVLPPSGELHQGDQFSISDGVNVLTFEIVDRDFVGSGADVQIEFDFSAPNASDELHSPLSAGQVANAIAQAINNSGLNVSAHSISTSGRVDIFGATWVDTPTSTIDHIVFDDIGDSNLYRDQGYTILESNRISYAEEYGILVDSGTRDTNAEYPHPGSALPLREANNQRWVPGLMIQNNVIAYNDVGGIHFSGDDNPDGTALAAVPFGSIVNNTLYGFYDQPVGTGILVSDRSSPTILNNIVANFETGIEILEGGNTSVVGATIYQGNGVARTGYGSIDNFERLISSDAPLFVDPAHGDFYLAADSDAIDSSIDSLVDREEMVNVRGELGFTESPVLAPDLDIYGQLRIDDPSVVPPPGLGRNVFKDRGAIDRVDFEGPTAWLIDPKDGGPQDRDTTPHVVALAGDPLQQFVIELRDAEGIGINDATVTPDKVQVFREGTQLTLGIDYLFSYDQTNNIIRLIPAPGIWIGTEYTIRLDNGEGGIRDLANNPLQPNTDEGFTEFRITMAGLDFGDAPDPPYYSLFDRDGARHVLAGGYYLGSGVSPEAEARVDDDADGDTYDDGVVFEHALLMGTDVSVVVIASRDGYLDGWIDFDDDGAWDTVDAPSNDEWVFRSVPLNAGENTLTVTVPDGGSARDAFARFRFRSTDTPIGVTGEADDGEVEDYKLRVVEYLEDFGDAPDEYQTTRASDGPIHKLADPIDAGLFLGTRVDPELDAIAGATATGDDMNRAENDEDGVRFVTPLVPGRNDVQLQVRASGSGYLNAWVDFNMNGQFEASEHLFGGTGQPVTAGLNNFTISVPGGTAEDVTYARFRLSSQQNLSWFGLADDGEVEDYRVDIISAPEDFGDAPEPLYPTTLASGGARHEMVVGFALGSEIDFEPDGQPSADAMADDVDTFVDDEDGVEFLDPFIPGRDVRVRVTATGTGGLVSAWVDWDGDGWGAGADDKILADELVQGTETFTIHVPGGLGAGTVFSRFRLSHTSGLAFDGPAEGEPAPDGEVEDYAVPIVVGTSSISGWKLNDRNANGVVDSGELGVAGVTIQLLDASTGQLIAETTTAADNPATGFDETGYYEFTGLFPDEYIVAEVVGADWMQTYPNADVDLPSGDQAHADGTYTIDLDPNEHISGIDFRNYRIARIEVVDTAVAEGNSGTTQVEVTLRLTESFGAPVTVDYQTRDGSATIADNDYQPASGTFEFPQLDEDPLPGWNVVSLTSNETNDYDYHLSGERIVWESFDGHDWEVFLQNGLDSDPIRLTNNATDDRYAFVYGSSVLWSGFDGNDWEIFHYDADTDVVTQVTDNDYDDKSPQGSETHVAWWGDTEDGIEIFYWQIGSTDDPVNISNTTADDSQPRISGDKVVWDVREDGQSNIYLYDGSDTLLLTPNNSWARRPGIDGETIVWEQYDQGDENYDIYYLQIGDVTPTRVMVPAGDADHDDLNPRVSGNYIVWSGYDRGGEDDDIFYHDIETGFTANLSENDTPDEKPAIDGSRVVWRTYDGNDWEVAYREIGSQLPTSLVSDNDYDDWVAEVSDSLIVWRGNDSPNPNTNDIEVYAATVRPAEYLATLVLQINGDLKIEPDESFFLDISNPQLAEIERATAEIGILNDDGLLDYGDAIEADYPTLLANNGARHVILPGFYLGDGVDPDGNGRPSLRADGDDRNATDDEDGVALPATLTIGSAVSVTVTASGAGVLDAWVDFNRDGDWDDTGERIFAGEGLSSGPNPLSFLVPGTAWPGESYARFRFSLNGVDSYAGSALSGEVEDYRVSLVAPVGGAGNTVFIEGTDDDDTFVVDAGSTYTVTLGDQTWQFRDYEVERIVINGGLGMNSVVFNGSERHETVSMWPDRAVFEDLLGNVRVEVNDTTQITANSGGGSNDLAKIYDSPQNGETYLVTPTEALLDGGSYLLKATGFASTIAYSQSDDDVAVMQDSTGDDYYLARGSKARMTGENYSNRVAGFAAVRGVASEGNDLADLYDHAYYSGTLDVRKDSVEFGREGTFSNSAEGFDRVVGHSETGLFDTVRFYGEPGIDVLEAYPTYVEMDMAGTDMQARAEGFRYSMSYGNPGDGDIARFYGSDGRDIYYGYPEWSRMYDEAGTYNHKATNFERVDAFSGGGEDLAVMRDSASRDVFTTKPDFSSMLGTTVAGWQFSNIARGFYQAVGSSLRGGDDVAYLYDSVGDERLYARPGDVLFRGADFVSQAENFAKVRVDANASAADHDTAYLYDSAMEDLLEADDDYVRMSSGDGDYLNWVDGFDYVEARTGQKDVDGKQVDDAVDFLVTLGQWRNL